MSSYKNFQTDNFKYSDKNKTDIYNPNFASNVQLDENKGDLFHENLDKWILFLQWSIWFP
ncbi:TPA: hypothetical protein N2D16_002929 [Clostridium botulinum]|nr:hypothetical protein [Clostridium botulinum]HCL4454993.1 hypothetical protein [Clostridium botulinum]